MHQSIFHRWMIRTTWSLWIGMAAVVLFSCGMQEKAEVAAPGDTGNITFSVNWVPSKTSPDMLALEAPSAKPLAATDICTTYGISQVQLEVWRDGTTPTSTGLSATAACTDHTATLTGVPAGVPDLFVRLTAAPQGWEGESARFTLSSGATQDLGEIVVDIPPLWYAAESLGVNSADTDEPDVGMDDSGSAIAVWREGVNSIYASRYTPGGGWGEETLVAWEDIIILGYPTTLSAPRIAMGANGDGIVIWKRRFWNTGASMWQNRVEARRYTPTGGWEPFSPVSGIVESGLDIGEPGIAMDDSGNAVVVWSMNTHGPTGTVFDIFTSRYSASSNSWAGTRLTTLAAGNNALYPQVGMGGNGEAFVVWQENTYDVYAQRFNGAAWENTPAVIGTWSTVSAEPQVAVDGSGSAIAIWKSHQILKGGGMSSYYAEVISANRYAASLGAWGGTGSIVDIGDARGGHGHRIAMDSAGNAVACWNWFTSNVTSSDMGGFATRYDALSGQWDVSISSVGLCGDIGMDDSGNAIIAFRPYVDPLFPVPSYDVLASSYNATTMAWETDVTIQSDAQGGGPRIAVNGAGEAMAVWTQSDGSYIRPYASRFY